MISIPTTTTTGAFTIDEFCRAHGISRALFYKLRKQGRAPRIMQIGSKPLVSIEAAQDWRKAMEQASAA
jgi:predicted DNA-binding transcriptional regulator AlpA